MLFCTSLVVQTGGGAHPSASPRRLQLTNTKVRPPRPIKTRHSNLLSLPFQRQVVICELNFQSTVLSVKLNRKRLVVLLEDKLHIFDISNMKSIYVTDIPTNKKGICAMSSGGNGTNGANLDRKSHWKGVNFNSRMRFCLSSPAIFPITCHFDCDLAIFTYDFRVFADTSLQKMSFWRTQSAARLAASTFLTRSTSRM